MDDLIAVPLLIASATLRVATPLILCAMGGLFSERAGIIDIGLEGKMLAGAFAAAATAAVTDSAWAGLGAALAVALALVAREGAGPLLATAFGLLAARALFMRRYRGLA